jgi:hypothetical protein
MGLGIKQNKTYLTIKDGKLNCKNARGGMSKYDYVEGILVGIEKKERIFDNGEAVPYWYFDIQESKGELYSLALSYNSGVAKSILNSLASVDGYGIIRIETYSKDGFNKVVVYNNGVRLNWKYTDLPPAEEVKVGDKIVKDETKRMELFNNIAVSVTNTINRAV